MVQTPLMLPSRKKSDHFRINVRRASKSFNEIPTSVKKLVSYIKSHHKPQDQDVYKRQAKSNLSAFFSENKSSKNHSKKSKFASQLKSGTKSFSENLQSVSSVNMISMVKHTKRNNITYYCHISMHHKLLRL